MLRWREDAGTAALSGRDLPSAEVLAADQRISARARELKSAGLAGTMDELRARAYLDFLLGRTGLPQPGTSDPAAGQPTASTAGPDRPGGSPDDADAGPDRPGGSPDDADAGPDRPGGSPAGAGAGPDRPGTSPAGAGAGPDRRDGGAGGRGTGSDGTATGPWPPAGAPGGLAARINVTVPLSTLLGTSGTPGEVAAFGPVDAELARELARAAGTHPATRWCVTVIGQHGQAVGHGCARGRHSAPQHPPTGPEGPAQDGPPPDGPAPDGPAPDGPARDRPTNGRAVPAEPLDPLNPLARAFLQRLRIRIIPLAVGSCDHRNEEPGYKPSRLLRHLIEARTPRCTAPGCRRPAAQCDQDHTIPYEAGGRTCECGLGPLCRRHHRCKHAQGWTARATRTWRLRVDHPSPTAIHHRSQKPTPPDPW